MVLSACLAGGRYGDLVRGLRTVSVVDALVASLRDRVLNGEIGPATGLTEIDLAAEYGVSRPSARTAITRLVAEGLLRREAHKPARVPQLTSADVEDLFLVRVPLELEVVRLLSDGRPLPPGAARAVEDLSRVGPDDAHSVFVEADLRFHRELVGALGSPRLSRIYEELSGEIHLCMVQSRHALGRDRIVTEHGGVLAAIGDGGPEQAVELMRAHLLGARDALAGAQQPPPRRAAQ